MSKAKPKERVKLKRFSIGISREVWEWAKANPRYESLMEELEDLEDLRREKTKKEKGITLPKLLQEYEQTHNIRFAR